jgi:superoxide dismutase, Fe-Mn family
MDMRQARTLVEAASNAEPIHMDPLPYKLDALEPALSRENVRIHYEILTKKYFDKYKATGDLFQKAGAVLHNDFYWPCMHVYDKQNEPRGAMRDLIQQAHGDYRKFQDKFLESALSIQGNGWVLLMQDMQIQTVQNHVTKPGIVLAYDQWEHSLTDYEFDREQALTEWYHIVNWDKVYSLVKS